ncbi:carboxypeptidase regulatory-like domain-containing protein [Pseudomonadota bacterium]
MKKLITALSVAGLCTLPLMGQAAAYKEVAVSNGGTITGKVTLAGKDLAPKKYKVSKDNAVCGEGSREIDFVRVANGSLQDVVVYLDKVKEGKAFPAEVGNGEALQEKCEFKPFLGVMRNGNKFAAINKDPVLHNIHTYELIGRVKKTVFNVSQPDQNTVTKTVKLKKGVGMKIECDAHDFMHAYSFVAKNPYFAVVKEDGSYSIDNVPPGKYKIKAWHGFLKDQKGKVEVKAGGTATVDFAFKGK